MAQSVEHIVHIDGGKNPMTAGGGNFIGFFLKLYGVSCPVGSHDYKVCGPLVRIQLSPPERKPLKINGFFFYAFTPGFTAPGWFSSV